MKPTVLIAASLFAAIIVAAAGDWQTSNAMPGDPCAGAPNNAAHLDDLITACTGDDNVAATEAVSALRQAGQAGLDALCAVHDRLLAAVKKSGVKPDPRIGKLRASIDEVAQQRDACASRLYWFTDLDEAMWQASASGKPILSLRLLGRLNEDRSCANSRFFRSVLYANAEISDYLREHYILHWESLRPVPQLTIDFGDGRRIERTITGNSIHYVLGSDGTIIDALPGLYGPAPFLRALRAAETAQHSVRGITDQTMRSEILRGYHAQAIASIDDQLQSDLAVLAAETDAAKPRANSAAAQLKAIPAAAVAPSKFRAEVKTIHAAVDAPAALGDFADDASARWARIAALHAADADLDARSMDLIASKSPTALAFAAQRRTAAKSFSEDPMMRMLREFRQSLAIDSVRNEFDLHRTIHLWLSQSTQPANDAAAVRAFNLRVYAEVFLTPLDDPWMGLAASDAYAAIDGGGLIDTCK